MIAAVPEEPIWTRDLLEAPHDAPDKASRVQRMFNSIAPRYQLTNRLCSGGRDAYWRRRAVERAGLCPDDQVLDVACGTGDFSAAFARAGPKRVVGCDFAHAMLVRAAGNAGEAGQQKRAHLAWVEADALQLPFADETFTIVSCAFGVRNFIDLDAGLREMHRVLRPGGRVVILEFTRPRHRLIRLAYELYANRIMPVAATWLSRDRSGAYRYLPRSVVSFLDAAQMCGRLAAAGFRGAAATPLTLGIVTVYLASRA